MRSYLQIAKIANVSEDDFSWVIIETYMTCDGPRTRVVSRHKLEGEAFFNMETKQKVLDFEVNKDYERGARSEREFPRSKDTWG